MTCTAIVVTFRTPSATLAKCLTSLKTSGVTQHIIIPNTPTHNPGFAAAANLGAKQAQTDLLLFVNPDALMTKSAYRQANNYLSNHPTCALVGFGLISPSGQTEEGFFGQTVTPLTLFTRHLKANPLPTQPTQVGWVSGGAMLIRRQAFQQVGGFDPRFFLYWEDVDLCRRLHQQSWSVALLPQAKVTHQRGASLNDQRRKTQLFDQSADKYFRKYYPKSICFILRQLRRVYRLFSPLVH